MLCLRRDVFEGIPTEGQTFPARDENKSTLYLLISLCPILGCRLSPYHIALDGACAVGAKAVYGRHEFQGVHVFVAFVVEGRSPRGGEFGHCLGRRCEDGRCRPCAILFYFVICSIIPKTMAASNPKISFRFRIGGWGGRGGGVFNTICVYYIWLFITLTGAVFGVR